MMWDEWKKSAKKEMKRELRHLWTEMGRNGLEGRTGLDRKREKKIRAVMSVGGLRSQ